MGLQLIMALLLAGGQIGHGHHLHHHTGPAGEVLGPLSASGFGVILLPGKSGLLPLLEDILNQVLAQVGIQLTSLFLVRAGNDRNILK
jgi:hypothetical protein